MGKYIFLIRHAQAERSPIHDDFNRPLSAQGFLEVSRMTERLYNHKLKPNFFISSPALRTLSTAKIFAENIGIPLERIQPENMIYEASMSTLLKVINHLDDKYNSIALFGHNPGITDIYNYLTNDFIASLPTCSIMQLEFEQEETWDAITGNSGQVTWKSVP